MYGVFGPVLYIHAENITSTCAIIVGTVGKTDGDGGIFPYTDDNEEAAQDSKLGCLADDQRDQETMEMVDPGETYDLEGGWVVTFFEDCRTCEERRM
jgi:hypothetical protein